jgi:hypothetical protein
MNYSEYPSDLKHIYQSEVYGSNVFSVAMKLTFDPIKKEKWRLLYELEVQTLNRFLQHIESTQQSCSYPWLWSIKGYFDGVAITLFPWKVSMKILAKETQSFTKIWKRLKTNAAPNEQGFFDYIYAHEKAIEAFATLEIAENERSTRAVQSLLLR